MIERIDDRKLEAKDKLDELEDQQTVQEAKITYAINHMHDIAKQLIDADYDLRVSFQTMLFPEGVTFNMNTKLFGTEKISQLYRYIPNKKDLSESEKSLVVNHLSESLHLIKLEGERWRTILEPAYRSYKLQIRK